MSQNSNLIIFFVISEEDYQNDKNGKHQQTEQGN